MSRHPRLTPPPARVRSSWPVGRAGGIASVLAALCLVAAADLPAQETEAEKETRACLEEAVVEAEIRRCVAARAERAQEAMDSTYARLSEVLDRERRAVLDGVQASWTAYRDEHCSWVASRHVGASLHRNVLNTCRARLTERRTRQLGEAIEAARAGGDGEG